MYRRKDRKAGCLATFSNPTAKVKVEMTSMPITPCCLSATSLLIAIFLNASAAADEKKPLLEVIAKPGLFEALTEPPCSYCSTQHRKGLIRGDDRVVAWLRGAHNGGAIPLRHFLAAPRVINDTYGLFFYDPDGGYVAAYEKDYGFKFYGWRRGVMVVEGPDGSLWSALTGVAFDGPKKGERLVRIPNMVTDWQHWLMLHPESTAYNLFDGKKYEIAPLPQAMSKEAKESMGDVDNRLEPLSLVLGIEHNDAVKAFSLDTAVERACFTDTLDGETIAVFWYGPTQSAVAFNANVDGRKLTFFADTISPETAPFKDRETGTRWTLAGRAVDGPLRGKELRWVDSIQCRWYAWSTEYSQTSLYESAK